MEIPQDILQNNPKHIQKMILRNQFQHIFRNVKNSHTINFISQYHKQDMLKNIAHINFSELIQMIIINNQIISVQPLSWINMPCLNRLQIGNIMSSSTKALSKFNFSNLQIVDFQLHGFNRIDKKYRFRSQSFDLQPLCRGKINNTDLFQIISSKSLNHDMRILDKLQVNQFNLKELNILSLQRSPFFQLFPWNARIFGGLHRRGKSNYKNDLIILNLASQTAAQYGFKYQEKMQIINNMQQDQSQQDQFYESGEEDSQIQMADFEIPE